MKLHPSSVRTLTLVVRDRARRPVLPPLGRQRPARARPMGEALCVSVGAAARRSQVGSARSASSSKPGMPIRCRSARASMTGVQLASVVHRLLLDARRAIHPAACQPRCEGRLWAAERRQATEISASAARSCTGRSGALSHGPDSTQRAPGAPNSTATRRRSSRSSERVARSCPNAPSDARYGCSPPRSACRCSRSRAAPTPKTRSPTFPISSGNFPDSRAVILPHIGHAFGIGGCVDAIMTNFVTRETTEGLITRQCDSHIVVPPFKLSH